MKTKILISTSTFAAINKAPLDKLIANGFEVVMNPYARKLSSDELLDLSRGVEGLIAGLETLNRKVLESSKLKVISRCGAGVSNIDLQAAKKLGIKVYSTPDAPVDSVAELTLAAILNLARKLSEMSFDMHSGKWTKKTGILLEGKTVAIIGFGRIGRRVASLLEPFKSKIIAVDQVQDNPIKGVMFRSLKEALPVADFVTIHISGEDEILGVEEFGLLKKNVFLLNCSRGNTINEVELMAALDSGKVAGAWLDCFLSEPYSGPLAKYPQVILTPHVGSYTVECRNKMELEAVDNLISGFSK